MVAGATEEEIYQKLGLAWMPPELRENRGELQAAREGRLPRIIGYEDIKGDLHVHCNWNGGANSIEDIAQAAMDLGYEYIGIADHTKFLRIEHGLDEEQLLAAEPGNRCPQRTTASRREEFYRSERLRGQYHERRQYRHRR